MLVALFYSSIVVTLLIGCVSFDDQSNFTLLHKDQEKRTLGSSHEVDDVTGELQFIPSLITTAVRGRFLASKTNRLSSVMTDVTFGSRNIGKQEKISKTSNSSMKNSVDDTIFKSGNPSLNGYSNILNSTVSVMSAVESGGTTSYPEKGIFRNASHQQKNWIQTNGLSQNAELIAASQTAMDRLDQSTKGDSSLTNTISSSRDDRTNSNRKSVVGAGFGLAGLIFTGGAIFEFSRTKLVQSASDELPILNEIEDENNETLESPTYKHEKRNSR